MIPIVKIIRPGVFSKQVAADNRRLEFDYKNEVIVKNNIPIEFVFIGDSIINMWELNAYFLNKNGLVINRGIGGDTSEYALKRFEADVIQLRPKYCVCLVGINDSSLMKDDPIYGIKGRSLDFAVANVVENITKMIGLSQKAGITFILCSVLPTNMTYICTGDSINEMVYRINGKLNAVADNKKAIYVDLHSSFVQKDGKTLRDGLSYDGLHPHVLGYDLMAEIIRDTLKQHCINI